MCIMRMIFAGTLATWSCEPNGSQPDTMSDLCSTHQSVTDTNCTATLQLWFQYYCPDRHEIT